MAFEDVYGEVLSASVVAGYYDQTNASYLEVLASLLPTGPAWLFGEDSTMKGLLEGMSYSYLRVKLRTLDLLEEFDPRTATELLDDWERLLGLPGDNPSPATTIAERRAAIHAQLLGNGDPTPQLFLDICTAHGYDALLKHREWAPFTTLSACIDALYSDEWRFYWAVITTPGDNDEGLEWQLRKLVPEHTIMDFVVLGQEWTEATLGDATKAWRGIAHDGSGLWVAVGENDTAGAQLHVSGDSVNWYNRSAPKTVDLFCVAHGNGLWVTAGQADGVDAYMLTSSDGETWTERSNPKNYHINGVAYNDGLWVAVGQADGTDSYLITSPDGITWTERSNPKNETLNAVCWHEAASLWVAAGTLDGTDAYLITSPDGITWTERSNPTNQTILGLSSDGSLLVGVGISGYTITSTDGINWTSRTQPVSTSLWGVASVFGYWIAVGDMESGTPVISGSRDGESWSRLTTPTVTGFLRGISYYDGKAIAVGTDGSTGPFALTSGV